MTIHLAQRVSKNITSLIGPGPVMKEWLSLDSYSLYFLDQ